MKKNVHNDNGDESKRWTKQNKAATSRDKVRVREKVLASYNASKVKAKSLGWMGQNKKKIKTKSERKIN